MAAKRVARCPRCGSAEVSESPSGDEFYCWSCHAMFSPDDAGTDTAGRQDNTRPRIALFMSYAHADEVMPPRILAELNGRSYVVSYDRRVSEGIRPGDDWRERIAEMIANSPDGVVAILSEGSLRPGGVCLDELSIAVGGYGQWDSQRRVWPVLVSPEGELSIPPTVARTQWLNLSGWSEEMGRGEEAFGTWLSGRMRELFSAIEDPEARRLRGDVATITGALPVPTETPRLAALLRRGLSGREWLTSEVRSWLLNPAEPQTCVVWGGPGTGKSAWAAHLAHYGLGTRGRVAAAIFLERDFDAYDDPCSLVQALAALLSFELPQYRRVLAGILTQRGSEVGNLVGEGRGGELFDLLLGKPLANSIDGGHEPVLVIVDGLDEAEGERGKNPVAETLGRIIPRLPPWVRFLLTSRDVESVRQALPPHEVRKVRLEEHAGECSADVLGYLEGRLADLEGGRELANAVASRAEGVFLYAELVADAALVPGAEPLRPDDLPDSLGRTVGLWFRTAFPDADKYARDCRPAMECLLAAGGPLPREELCRVLKWGGDQTADFLRAARTLVGEGRDASGRQTVSVSHGFVREWLSSDAAGKYHADPRDGLGAMASSFAAMAHEDLDSLTDYELIRVLPLLKATGMSTELASISRNPILFIRMIKRTEELGKKGNHAEALALAQVAYDALSGTKDGLQLLSAGAAGALADELKHYGHFSEGEALERESLKTYRGIAESNPETGLPDVARSCSNLAITLQNRGKLADAVKLEEEALAIYRQLAESDPATYLSDVGWSCVILAAALHARGDLTNAEPLLREALDIYRQLAKDNPRAWQLEVVMSCGNLANLLSDQGNLEGAESLQREALVISRQLAESDSSAYSSYVAKSCGNLANILRERGDLSGSESLGREAVATYRQLAESDPDGYSSEMAWSCDTLAITLRSRGNLTEAESLEREALMQYQLLAESDSSAWLPSVARTCVNLANVLRNRGTLDEAEKLEREALTSYQDLAVLDSEAWCSYVAAASENLATTLHNRGNLADAEKLEREALATYQGLAKSDSSAWLPNVARSCENLGVILRDLGELADSERLEREAVATYQKLAESDPMAWLSDEAQACGNLAVTLHDRGELADAVSLSRKALAYYRQLAESDSIAWLSDIAQTCGNLAAILHTQGDLEGALELSKEALTDYRQLDGSDPGAWLPDVARTCGNLANVLNEKGDLDEAELLAREALTDYRQLDGSDPGAWLPDVARTCGNLANVLRNQGNLDEAEPFAREALTDYRRFSNSDQDIWLNDLARSGAILAAILRDKGDLDEADKIGREAMVAYLTLRQKQLKH